MRTFFCLIISAKWWQNFFCQQINIEISKEFHEWWGKQMSLKWWPTGWVNITAGRELKELYHNMLHFIGEKTGLIREKLIGLHGKRVSVIYSCKQKGIRNRQMPYMYCVDVSHVYMLYAIIHVSLAMYFW